MEDTDNRAQHIPFGVWLKKRLKIEEVYNFLTRYYSCDKKSYVLFQMIVFTFQYVSDSFVIKSLFSYQFHTFYHMAIFRQHYFFNIKKLLLL